MIGQWIPPSAPPLKLFPGTLQSRSEPCSTSKESGETDLGKSRASPLPTFRLQGHM
jgi:hypothetical protein